MTALKVQNLRFRYSTEDVLKKISFDIPKGSFVSILGPNGSGKTTLLKTISHILKPDEGNVLLKEKTLREYGHKELARSIAVVHQNQPTDFDFTVEDVVLMGRYPHLRQFQSESTKDHEVTRSAMQRTAISHLREKNLKHISGGERQRVMIARALAQETDTLLLDEPISHLDIKYQLEILKMCRGLSHEKDMTIITTLHDINMAARFSDYMILMKSGEIIEMGTPEEVMTPAIIRAVYDVEAHITHLDNQRFAVFI